MVVDIITGECRVVPSLPDTIYGDGNPPADGGLAPDEELVHQCPDDIPIGHELEGWALTPVGTERNGGIGNRRPLSSPPGRYSQGRFNFKARTRLRGNTHRWPQPPMNLPSPPGSYSAEPWVPHQRPKRSTYGPRRSQYDGWVSFNISRVTRDVPIAKNQLLWFRNKTWSKIDNATLKAPEWVFEYACDLRLGPLG